LYEWEQYLASAPLTVGEVAAVDAALARFQATVDARLGRSPLAAPVAEDEEPKSPGFARSLAVFYLRGFRFVTNWGLRIAFFLFLFIFFWQLPHPAHWNEWGWAVALQKLGGVVLGPLDAWLGWPEARPFVPLALVVAASLTNIFLDTRVNGLIKRLGKVPRPAPMPAPVRLTRVLSSASRS
jgi:hypothetical protein